MREMTEKHEKKIRVLRAELELRRKAEIHGEGEGCRGSAAGEGGRRTHTRRPGKF